MSIPAWQVINWTPVQIKLRDFQRTRSAFRHLGTSVHPGADQADLRCGQALWGMQCGQEWIGLAFEWAEMDNRVVALSDPMQILSNVTLLRDDGECLEDAHRIVEFNTAVHELDWQQEVPGERPVWAERLAA